MTPDPRPTPAPPADADRATETESETEGPAADEAAALLFSVFNEIGIIAQLSGARLTRVLPDGMQMSHFTVLNHFARLGGERTPAQLARAFQVTKGAMTNTLQRLEGAGFVAIRPDPGDGRRKIVAVTPQGLAARDRAIAALGGEMADLTGRLDLDRLATMLPHLRRLREILDADRDPRPRRG